MNPKLRKIEVDARTAELLEARAAARGMTVSQLLADLIDAEEALSPALAEMRDAGRGPWAPEVLAEDARRLAEFQRTREAVPWDEVKAWMQSWATANELPPPKPRKL
jgi:predicted transcriptional regulator